jgi:hypothetical protein
MRNWLAIWVAQLILMTCIVDASFRSMQLALAIHPLNATIADSQPEKSADNSVHRGLLV